MTPALAPADPDSAFDAYRATRHFGSLDGLRFLCISAVIWHHSPLSVVYMDQFALAGRGFIGVDFFFVLSGFLITTLLLREERKTGRFSLSGFYWRRALRILPVYLTLVSAVAFYYIVVKGEAQYLELLPYYYLFLSNFLPTSIPLLAPMWSLAVEEQYYLLWPALLLVLPRRWIVPLLLVVIVANVVGVLGAFAVVGITAFDAGPLRVALPNATYAPILIGSLVALLLERREWFARLYPLAAHRSSPLLAFLGVLAALQLLPEDIVGLPNLLIHSLMAFALITLVVREDNGLRAVLAQPLIVRIGQISYGIYLYHLVALHFANAGLRVLGVENGWVVLGVYYALSILIAEVSFRTLEAYFQGFRSRK